MSEYLQSTKKLNVVICGFGSAGRSRLKAIQALPELFELKGIVSKRNEVATLSLESALNDPQVDALLISTENTRHFDLSLKSLKAGKHVLCDYPPALSVSELDEIQKTAKMSKKIFHCEVIGLLSQAHIQAKVEMSSLGRVISGDYFFNAGWNNKLASRDYSGPLEFVSFSRLMQLADWFGEFKIVQKSSSVQSDSFELKLDLEFNNGGHIRFIEKRAAGLKRERSFKAQFESQDFEWNTGVAGDEGLFLQDLQSFHNQVTNKTQSYYDPFLLQCVTRELCRTIDMSHL